MISLWERLSPDDFPPAPLNGEIQVDLAIVGAGFLGLSTALHAAESGLSVAVIEAERPGHGASGRNTGFVVPSLKASLGPDETAAALGERYARRLLAMVARSGERVFDLIARFRIDAAAEQNGWLQPAHSAAAAARLRARLPMLEAAGVDARWLDREAMAAATGLPGFHGGLIVPSGGQLNPLAYTRGLARAARAGGARVFTDSPVRRIARAADGWEVRVDGGRCRARTVLLATNALTDGLSRAVSRSIVPIRVFQIATETLPEEIQRTILPSRAPLADTRRHTFALRWSPDGRLVTGGLVPPARDRAAAARRRFIRRISEFVPGLPPLEAEFCWSGVIATTPNLLPEIMDLGDGMWAAIGCNGRGVAMTTALGRELGRCLSGEIGPGDLPLPVAAPRPRLLSGLAALGPPLWLTWSEARDAAEARAREGA